MSSKKLEEELDKDEVRKIAYNCSKATYLIEKKQLESITIREELELKIHMAGCSICRIFEKQSITINKMVKDIFLKENYGNLKLEEEFKKGLQEKIDDELTRQ